MTFDNALKKWFYQNNSAAAAATARIPLLNASGAPIGSDTLPHVLGAMGGSVFIGTCSTAAATAAKTVSISGFTLAANVAVAVRFSSAVNIPNATLNISSTGAKEIRIDGAALQPNVIKAGMTALMVYDGTRYNVVGLLGLEQSITDDSLFVDMGLPSGLLWAKRNIDVTQADGFAASEYQYECSFFSWGNTAPHNPSSTSAFEYNWGSVNENEPYYENQPYGSTPGAKLTANISPSFDAARATLGAPWRLPTSGEFQELFNNSVFIDASGNEIATSATDKTVTMNGIMGVRLKSNANGNILFFPCAGYGSGRSWYNRGSSGYYWSSSFNSARYARGLSFDSGGVYPQYTSSRYIGFPVRPVQ